MQISTCVWFDRNVHFSFGSDIYLPADFVRIIRVSLKRPVSSPHEVLQPETGSANNGRIASRFDRELL
jgi:hypothetical protein